MSGLTGRETLLRVFRQQDLELIPASPFIHINYVKEFFGSHTVDPVVKTPEVYAHFGFDLIHRNCTPVYDALGPEGYNWHLEADRQQNGRDETTTKAIITPDGRLCTVEALRWVHEYEAESCLTEYPIKSEADLALMERYQPACRPADLSDIERARAVVGDEGLVAPWIQGAFNLLAGYYRKLDSLLIDALTNPSFYQRMMDYALGRYQVFVQQLIGAGVDVLSYAGNVANGKLVGHTFFEQHVWPYEKRLIDFIQRQGIAVLYHNCGYARNLMPLYPTLELRAYESLTPPPFGDTILSEAVEVFGPKTTLLGNIDQIELLRRGTKQEIGSAVKRTLDTVRGRCHFILATTDYFNEGTPHDNIHALAEAARRHGRL